MPPESLDRAGFLRLHGAGPEPAVVYDIASWAVQVANDAMAETYGYSHEQLEALTVLDLRATADVVRMASRIAAINRGHEVQDGLVWRHIRSDGAELLVRVRARTIDFEGSPARLVRVELLEPPPPWGDGGPPGRA